MTKWRLSPLLSSLLHHKVYESDWSHRHVRFHLTTPQAQLVKLQCQSPKFLVQCVRKLQWYQQTILTRPRAPSVFLIQLYGLRLASVTSSETWKALVLRRKRASSQSKSHKATIKIKYITCVLTTYVFMFSQMEDLLSCFLWIVCSALNFETAAPQATLTLQWISLHWIKLSVFIPCLKRR